MKSIRSKWMHVLWTGALAVFVLGVASCASTPKDTVDSGGSKSPPDWVLSPPKETDQYSFFVGSASNPEGDVAKAEEQAIFNLIAEITRYLGVRVTSETTSEAKASLDRFQAQVTQQVKQEGSARVSGLRVADKFIQKEGTRVSVYILAQYDRTELEKEKARIEAVFREQVDAVALPEERGKRLEMEGDLFGAIRSYIEAAVAAATSKVENAEIKFERNINHAKRVVSRIGLVPLTGEMSGMLGEPLPSSFKVKIVDGQSASDPPVAGAEVQVSYKEVRAGGRPTVRTVGLKSGEDGVVEFNHPVPTFVGKESVVMVLDLSAYLAPLENVPRQYRALVNSLEDLILSKRVDLPYTIISRAKDIPTGVVILDLDAAGNPIGTSRTSAGVLESLTAAGFKAMSASLDPVILKERGDSEVIRDIAARFGDRIERVVFGTVGIDEFIENRGQYQVRVTGTLKAADLKTGEVLYTKRMLKRSIGSNAEAAIGAAFRSLGIDFGEDLARSLP
ncbi:MAG: hypothetical protein Kow009_01340 [Spirochaetales bacterium]